VALKALPTSSDVKPFTYKGSVDRPKDSVLYYVKALISPNTVVWYHVKALMGRWPALLNCPVKRNFTQMTI